MVGLNWMNRDMHGWAKANDVDIAQQADIGRRGRAFEAGIWK